MLNSRQFLVFLSSWMAWIADAFDFFSVSVTVPDIAATYGKTASEVTWAITLALLMRSPGAIIFGLLGDRFGRKWPMVGCLILIAVFDIGVSFAKTFNEFLIIRALYGIALGGIWGCAMGVALENMPHECRGLYSGILQQGYALGYLLAAVMNLVITPNQSHGWRALFWFSVVFASVAAIFRATLPDDDAVHKDNANKLPTAEKTKLFLEEIKGVFKHHPWRLVHAVFLMAGFNYMSHGSQDLYPTFLVKQLGYNVHIRTVVTAIFNCGAIIGGTLCGYLSQKYGRRLVIIIACVCGGALIPLWFLPKNWPVLAVGAFFLQFCVQGAWGVIPVHLNEISPSPRLRAAFAGIAYQIGNALSAPSAQIESSLGEHFPTGKFDSDGKSIPDYGKVQAILMAVVFAFVIVLTAIGPEFRGRRFESEEGEVHVIMQNGRASIDIPRSREGKMSVEIRNSKEGVEILTSKE